jgi:hypothetical protein
MNSQNVVVRVAEAYEKQQLRQQSSTPTTSKSSAAAVVPTTTGSSTCSSDHPIPIPSIATAIVRMASEYYRLLALQVPVGTIQLKPTSQKDTAERRAAALLEYCTRQHYNQNHQHHQNKNHETSKRNQKEGPGVDSSSQRPPTPSQQLLSWTVLAHAVQTKTPQPLQQLQHILINFLQPSSSRISTKNPMNNNNTGTNASTMSQRPTPQHQNTTIPAVLCDKDNNHQPTQQPQRTRRSHPSHTSIRSSSSTTTTTAQPCYVPRILPELVIRLTGYLVDPHGIQVRTGHLMTAIYTYYDPPPDTNKKNHERYSVTERRGHLYDLQRYGAAYEAAALYCVATSVLTHSHEYNDKGRTKKKIVKKPKTGKYKDEVLDVDLDGTNGNVEKEEDCDDDEHDTTGTMVPSQSTMHRRGLQIDDLVEASTEFTYLELQQVLPRVQTMAQQIAQRDRSEDRTSSSNSSSSTVQNKKSSAAVVAASVDINETETTMRGLTVNSMDTECYNSTNDLPCTQPTTTPLLSNESIIQWKTTILSQAIDKVKQNRTEIVVESTPTATTTTIVVESQETEEMRIMQLCANAVLQKYGIVP